MQRHPSFAFRMLFIIYHFILSFLHSHTKLKTKAKLIFMAFLDFQQQHFLLVDCSGVIVTAEKIILKVQINKG